MATALSIGMRAQPLADLRIVAVEQYGAGPWGTMQLSDLGATVIKVEDPLARGDVGRYVPPYQEGESSLFFESFNRSKLSVSLDLRHPDARRVFEDIVCRCDAVFSNLRGDQPERLGLRFADLETVNPRIVCCSLSGFGMTGPRRASGAYDYTLQGLAGWQSVTGEPDGPPIKSGLSLVDFCGGYVAALAILGGVWRARRDGRGCDVDLALFEVALAQLTYLSTWVASRGYEPRRRARSAHQSMVPFQNFETADGWIVVACPKQRLWEQLCAAVGRPELASDPRFAGFADRDKNRDELLTILYGVFRERNSDEWLALLLEAGVPAAPINDIAAALADDQAVARGCLVETDHPLLGSVRQVASPFRYDADEPPVLRRAPFRGEHTAQVLADVCDYGQEHIANLARRGVFGDPATTEVIA